MKYALMILLAVGVMAGQTTNSNDNAARNTVTALPGKCQPGVQYYLLYGSTGTYICNIDGASYSKTGANLRDFISVKDFGAVNDCTNAACTGATDNTAAFNSLFASAPAGSTIYFPCSVTNGNYYVAGRLNFTGYHLYQGSNPNFNTPSCSVISGYGGAVAFSFKDARYSTLRDMNLTAINSTSVPKAVLGIGFSTNSANGQSFTCDHSWIQGWASTAVFYSIGAEQQVAENNCTLILSGGGGVAYYTDSTDSASVDSYGAGSNTSIHWSHCNIQDFTSPAVTDTHALVQILDNGVASTQNVSFRDCYLATNGDGGGTAYGSGFNIDKVTSGILIDHNRLENGIYFATIPNNVTGPTGLTITNNFLYGNASTLGFVNSTGSTSVTGYTERGNAFYGVSMTSVGSYIPVMYQSNVDAPYLVNFAGRTNSRVCSYNYLCAPVYNDLTGINGVVASIVTYTSTQIHTYQIGGYINITARATDVLNLQVSWYDEANVSHTQALYPVGTTSPNTGAVGFYVFTPIVIRAEYTNPITVSTILQTGGGTITYDVGATITMVN